MSTSGPNVNASTKPSSGNQAYSAPSDPPPIYDARPLPAGWVKEFDPKTGRNFFVDSLAEPPRAIWVHPLEDPEFIRLHRTEEDDHPDSDDDHSHHSASNSRPPSVTTGKLQKEYPRDEKKSHPDDDHLRVPSTEGEGSSHKGARSDEKGKKRGFFGKLKDKAIGTKEEREAARKAREARAREEERLYYERRDAMLARRVQQMEREQAAYERAGLAYPPGQYGYNGQVPPPQMNAYGGPTYQDPYVYGQSPYRNQRGYGGGGGGGTALIGGLLGGLLLGDLLF